MAKRYIDKDRLRVSASRAAAKSPRRGKWADVKVEAVEIAARIAARRSGLTASSLAEVMLSELGLSHDELPDRTTVLRWTKDFVH